MCANLAIVWRPHLGCISRVLHIDICVVCVLYYDKTEGGQGGVYMIYHDIYILFIHSLMGMHAYVVGIYNKIITYNYIWYICVSCVCGILMHFVFIPWEGCFTSLRTSCLHKLSPTMHAACTRLAASYNRQFQTYGTSALGKWKYFICLAIDGTGWAPPSHKLVYKPH